MLNKKKKTVISKNGAPLGGRLTGSVEAQKAQAPVTLRETTDLFKGWYNETSRQDTVE